MKFAALHRSLLALFGPEDMPTASRDVRVRGAERKSRGDRIWVANDPEQTLLLLEGGPLLPRSVHEIF